MNTILYSIFTLILGCSQTKEISPKIPMSTSLTEITVWDWSTISIPSYTYPDGTAFGNGLFVDAAYNENGVYIEDGKLQFDLVAEVENQVPTQIGDYNYRSEIRTAPWQINHPLGTEQWIGWSYIFDKDYQANTFSPATIFQNHPGIRGESPQIELEIAALDRPSPAQGGEIQIINSAMDQRILTEVRPLSGDTLDIVIQVVFGKGPDGLLKIWLDGTLIYDQVSSTVYNDYPWGGNNKWGVYHHTYLEEPNLAEKSIDAGFDRLQLAMSDLRLITRSPNHKEYRTDAFHLVSTIW